MSSLAIARAWVTKANLALQHAGFTAHATIDPVEARSALNSGSPAVLVEISNTTFETWNISNHELRIIVISNLSDVLAGWEVLDKLIDDLKEPLELDSAQLTMYQTEDGKRTYPALLCTTTEGTLD